MAELKCEHKWPRQYAYGVMRAFPAPNVDLNRIQVSTCNNCPAVKVVYEYPDHNKEIIVEP